MRKWSRLAVGNSNFLSDPVAVLAVTFRCASLYVAVCELFDAQDRVVSVLKVTLFQKHVTRDQFLTGLGLIPARVLAVERYRLRSPINLG